MVSPSPGEYVWRYNRRTLTFKERKKGLLELLHNYIYIRLEQQDLTHIIKKQAKRDQLLGLNYIVFITVTP